MQKMKLFFFLLFIPVLLFAKQNNTLRFVHLGLNEGLSQSSVFSITQDERGQMWFATSDGVNRYDGYAFTVYEHNENDPHTIACGITRTLFRDSSGRIWVGTREGLSLYDAEKDCFQNFYQEGISRLTINSMVDLSEDKLLLSTSEGLMTFDIHEQRFDTDFLHAILSNLQVNTLYRQGDHLYIGTTNSGVYAYSLSQKHLTPLTGACKDVQAILQQASSLLWIATEGDGLLRVDLRTKKVKQYMHDASKPESIASNFIRSLCLDAQNRLWIGTFTGLSIYNEESDSFITYSSDPIDMESLSQPSVRSIFMDAYGGMWLGTYFGGLNYYHHLRNRFAHIRHIPFRNSLNDNIVSCIVEDNAHNLWIGTNDGGLNYYDVRKDHFIHYKPTDLAAGTIASDNIKAVWINERQEKVYIGTHGGGFNILDRKTGRITIYHTKNSTLPGNNVYALLPSADGRCWIGTLEGLSVFDPERLTFSTPGNKTLSEMMITVLFRDSRQRLWAGGEEGFLVCEDISGNLKPVFSAAVDSLSNSHVNCVTETSDGSIWIGTRQGAIVFNPDLTLNTSYTVTQGLPNNIVLGILEDNYGRIWMSTNNGLACLPFDSGKLRVYTAIDGIQSNQFNPSSCCMSEDGQIYFGGINGMTVFNPHTLIDNLYAPPTVISRLSLFDKKVMPGDETGLLSKNISMTRRIVFKPHQTSFTLDFVVSNYISGQHNTFAYMLEGYDEEWIVMTDKHFATYSNLPHGKYLFQVKAANNDGRWNNNPTTLEIVILPVWYKTWWAMALFVMTAVTAILLIIRFFWMRKSMQAALEMERREKVHIEEINQLKARFFINISHEFRTPLTLILAPLHEVISKVNDRWVKKQLELIQRNANKMLHLVNLLMDYRKAELEVLNINVIKGNIDQYVREICEAYEKLAESKKIAYTLHLELQSRNDVLFDPHYVMLILNNLLSNAFKCTESGQQVSVTLKYDNQAVLMQISDTGIGVPEEKQTLIFERFYQLKNDHMSSGIGLSLVKQLVDLHHGSIELRSKEGEGTTFTVSLPQSPEMYKQTDFAGSREPREDVEQTCQAISEFYVMEAVTGNTEMEEVVTQERKRGTVLIVDDNVEILNYLAQGLSARFSVVEAHNGEEALALLRKHEVDIIITDIMMPVMDGIKLCKSIKQNMQTCHIPVIFLSAKTDVNSQIEGLLVGADDYINKPFTLSVISAKLQNILRTRWHTLEHYNKSLRIEPEKLAFNPIDEDILKRAVAVVEKHLDDIEFSADDFAREMNMSRSTLHLKLKAVTGASAIDFVRKVRFNEACRLLKEGRYNVAEVSSMVGFNTPSYFATSFKKYFGFLPTDYMKNKR